jgi:putative FmdB family regulatory protein
VPTYEYVCSSCGTHVEVYQRFSDDPLTVCGVCGGSLRKVFHPAGILFKGSGFYATDSRSGRGAGGGKSESDSGSRGKDGAKGGETGGGARSGEKKKTDSSGSSGTKEKSA